MMARRPRADVLGAILAGGANRRYGSPKALAVIGGERIVERAIAAMREATERVVIVANDRPTYEALGLPLRADARPGLGSLGGVYTAVRWAAEEGCAGALLAACDMPFLSSGLLRELCAAPRPDEVVAPASESRRGLEPLCAYYGVDCRAAIERAIERGDRAIISFFDEVRVRRLPPETVRRFGDSERLFWNVNTPEDRERAERWAREGTAP